jgi:phospholipid/cholesterol/gamma-HCH transport system ATP-binding protein
MSDETDNATDAPEQGSRDVLVRCEDLVCGYGDTPVLEDINCQIERGEIVALLGGSGSGKSTLLKTMVGLLPPLSGTVEILGRDPYALEDEARSNLMRRIGMMFQHGALFGSDTVYENIALPAKEHTDLPEPVIREMVRQKLSLVGLEGLENRLPSDISGGQRKRVALVRASILDPDIVFADEPSAGLDPIVAAGVDHVLRQFQDLFDMTMIVVTHVLESVEVVADRVLMLADGGIIADGSFDDLYESDDKEVHDFFHRQAPEFLESREGDSVLKALERRS